MIRSINRNRDIYQTTSYFQDKGQKRSLMRTGKKIPNSEVHDPIFNVWHDQLATTPKIMLNKHMNIAPFQAKILELHLVKEGY